LSSGELRRGGNHPTYARLHIALLKKLKFDNIKQIIDFFLTPT